MANVCDLPEGALVGDTDCWRHAREAWKMLRDLPSEVDPELATPDYLQYLGIGLLAARFSGAMLTGQKMTDEDFTRPSLTMGEWQV